MQNQSYTTTLLVDTSAEEAFNAINNVRGWWSEEIEGDTEKLNDEFNYQYNDVHSCRMKLIEVLPEKKVVWLVLDNYFSFTKNKSEWIGTKVVFEISRHDNKTQIRFTHLGLVPDYECYSACVNGWTHYIEKSLLSLITTGKGQPNSKAKAYTIHEIAARFNELAREEKWFEIQEEFFTEDVRSIELSRFPYLENAEGKSRVRKKATDWVNRIETVHRLFTTEPIVAGNHFAVGREMDLTMQGLGRVQINEIMLYEVKDGRSYWNNSSIR